MLSDIVKIGKAEYEVHSLPVEHVLMDVDAGFDNISHKERLLINPFNGCSHRCLFCFTNNRFDSPTFRVFRDKNIITVLNNIPEVLSEQLENKKIDGVVHLSPSTDPFQPINNHYNLTEKILNELVKNDIPFAVSTKADINDTVIDYLKRNPKSFAEISILTLNENLRSRLVKGGGLKASEQIKLMQKLVRNGIKTIARVDPIYPYITDDHGMLKDLIDKLHHINIKTVLSSCAKIPVITLEKNWQDLKDFDSELIEKYDKLYNHRDEKFLYADVNYRIRLFGYLKTICMKKGMDFRLCLEHDEIGIHLERMI